MKKSTYLCEKNEYVLFFILQKNKKLARVLLYKKSVRCEKQKIKMCRNRNMDDQERRYDDRINHCNTRQFKC